MNDEHHNYSRRDFVKTALGGMAAGALFMSAYQDFGIYEVPTRVFKKTGERIPILGLGGHTIGKRSVDEKDGIAIMHEAIDRGMSYFDNCWDYNNGVSEERMGKAIKESWRRDKVFLMTKTCGRLEKDATVQLEESMKRLNTDIIDLWMFHGIRRPEDRDLIFSKNGAIHAAIKAKQEGKVRYIGFSGHQHPDLMLGMLEEDFDWDFVLMPINVFDYHYRSFYHKVLPVLNERGVGVLGMKSLLAGNLPRMTDLDVDLCRRFSLSMPITSLTVGIETKQELDQVIKMAANFKPLTEDDMAALLALTEKQGKTGELERYKLGRTGCDWHLRQYGNMNGV